MMSNSFVYHDPYAEPGVPIDPYSPRLKPGTSPARIALFANLWGGGPRGSLAVTRKIRSADVCEIPASNR